MNVFDCSLFLTISNHATILLEAQWVDILGHSFLVTSPKDLVVLM